MTLFGWLFTLAGTAAGAWGITETLAGDAVRGAGGVLGMIVAYAAAMIQED